VIGAANSSGIEFGVSLPRPAYLRLVTGVGISIATLAALAWTVDLSPIREALAVSTTDSLVVGLAALAYTAAFWLRAVAWRSLLTSPPPDGQTGNLATGQTTPQPPTVGELFSILQTSLFLNHLLLIKAGEVARPYLAAKRGVPPAVAVSTTLVARLADFAALVLLASVALSAAGEERELLLGLQAMAVLIGLAAAALLLLRQGSLPLLPRKLTNKVASFQAALRQISAGRLAASLPLVLVSWVLESGVLLASARLMGAEISLTEAVGATAFTILFQVIHLTPGGIGVYEASMSSVLALQGMPLETAAAVALLTHGLKFAYSFTVGLGFAAFELVGLVKAKEREGPKKASRFEIVTARAWNVVNEGKPFTPVFTLCLILLSSLPQALDIEYWQRAGLALVAIAPLGLVFWRFDFPLHLRTGLWVYLAAFLVVFQFFDLRLALLAAGLYLVFTVFVWGTVYYHLRIGTRWTNFLRFWRLVLENPDPTSGNLQEQLPKCLLLLLAFRYLAEEPGWQSFAGIEAFTVVVAVSALLVHQWFFNWVPPLPQRGLMEKNAPSRLSRRFIAIVIDGCRADRLLEANTPYIDRLRRIGTTFTDMSTVYPARTVTCFSSMLTGAPAKVHGMHSNFVPSLGVKCESVFDSLRGAGLKGRLVGIAHLIDAFGQEDVRSVTAVMDNDEIDDALVAQAKRVMKEEDPELLVLQLLSVDQTGHARGSYNDEYLGKIEATDRIIESFLTWCEGEGYLEDATLLLTADHGQGIGIGGHGHMSPPEIRIPCIVWGKGVPAGVVLEEPRFITDIADTVCHCLGVKPPGQSVGRSLLLEEPGERASTSSALLDGPSVSILSLPALGRAEGSKDIQPLVYVIPALNEAKNLPAVLDGIRSSAPEAVVVVVDDGSTDETAAVAERLGAVVVRHERNRGLGAALRTGLAAARDLRPRAVVYLDADGEYDPREASRLLAPIERGETDYVLGSRFKGRVEGMTWSRRLANRGFSALLSLLAGRWISDGQTGFRAFSGRAASVAEIIHDYNYAQVLTLDLLHKGMRITEAPITYRRRRSGRSFISPRYLWRVPLGMAREMLGD
jgi:uncharacterized membrane protein YbhN (UPF0104 family)